MIRKLLLFTTVIFLISAFIPKKKKEFIPPGTAKINDTLFADETEISNCSWQEYELWLKQKFGYHSKEHKSFLPDTLVWRDKGAYNEPYVEYYYRHPAYRNYPVVGISYEQALEFCRWRTERVKENLAICKKHLDVEFEYRLPSKWEWEFVSSNGTGYFSGAGRNDKGFLTSNHVWVPRDSMEEKKEHIFDNADVTTPVYSYNKNIFGLYQMIGNVSEMVLEKGISKGGSWRHRLEQCRIGKDIAYEKPSAWLGFRCVCVVKKKKIS